MAFAVRATSPAVEVMSPFTSTRALFFTIPTVAAATGIAEVVPSALAGLIFASSLIVVVASACRFTSPAAVIFPFSFRFTWAVVFFRAPAASICRPSRSLSRSFPASIAGLVSVNLLLSNLWVALAEISALPSVSIAPSTSTLASRLVFIIVSIVGEYRNVLSCSVAARRMISPLLSSATAVMPTPERVAFVTTVPPASLAFTRLVKSIFLFPRSRAPFLMSMWAAPSSMPLRVFTCPAISIFPSVASLKPFNSSCSAHSVRITLNSPLSLRFPKFEM